jgi:hypothetical protein
MIPGPIQVFPYKKLGHFRMFAIFHSHFHHIKIQWELSPCWVKEDQIFYSKMTRNVGTIMLLWVIDVDDR